MAIKTVPKNVLMGQGKTAHYVSIYHTLNCVNTLYAPPYVQSFSYLFKSTRNIIPFCA